MDSITARAIDGTQYWDRFKANHSLTETITGQVTDQDGNPIDNATVISHSITEPALDKSDAKSLERQADELRDELTNPLPSSWDEDFDLESHYQDANANYVLVHESEDWGIHGASAGEVAFFTESNVDNPRLQVDSDQRVVLSMWDPEEQGRSIGPVNLDNQVDNSFPGATVDGTIVVEQLSPTSEVVDRREYETETIATTSGGRLASRTEHPGVRTSLPAGVYRAYPDGAPERGYTFVVGSPSELASTWESDLRDRAGQYTQRAERIRDLLSQEHVTRSTVRTDANGEFSVDVPSNAVTTDLKAMKADGELLKNLENPQNASLEDLRRFQTQDYNGTFYLPSPKPKTVEAPAENVSVTVYRSPEVPLGDMSTFADLMSFLDSQRLNETVSELENEYNQRLEEMERSSLERIYTDHRTLTETVPRAEDRYLERSQFSELQAAEDLSTDELSTETRHMQVALAGIGEIEPPDLGDSPINIDDGGLNLEYPLPGGIDSDTVAPEIHWSDGTVEPIPEEYWSIESGGIFAGGGQKLVISDLPIEDTDPAAFDIRVQAASSGSDGVGGIGGSDGGRLDDRINGLNPAFGGSIPTVNAVDFSTLAPGPSEKVYVGVQAESDTGYGQLVDAQAWDDDGNQLNATVDTERDRASFRTGGAGTHQVRLTFENSQGDRFVISERVRAHEQSRSDPATVRASESTIGTHAVTGEQLASARIDSSAGRLKIDVIADSSDGPGTLVLKPANAMSGNEHSFEVNVLHGNSEERVNAHVPIELHLENLDGEKSALFWRSSAGFGGDPITWDGDTRFGSVSWQGDGKAVLRTYTTENGQLETTTIKSPGLYQNIQHRVARTIGDIPNPLGMIAVPAGGLAVIIPAGILAKRRYHP